MRYYRAKLVKDSDKEEGEPQEDVDSEEDDYGGYGSCSRESTTPSTSTEAMTRSTGPIQIMIR